MRLIKMYNKTQIVQQFQFGDYHRDQFAHYLRWAHVLKLAKSNMKILDFGCGSGMLLNVFYKNNYAPSRYLGLDIREAWKINKQKYFDNWKFKAEFKMVDLCGSFDYGDDWDIICCFEVAEHVGKKNIDSLLSNLLLHCGEQTTVLLSTPNYDRRVGAAKNHIIDGEVCEFEHSELEDILKKYFVIDKKYGTFASIKDYKHLLNDWQTKMFDNLNEYYDANLLSILMAPMFPEQSRNCLWQLKRKKVCHENKLNDKLRVRTSTLNDKTTK